MGVYHLSPLASVEASRPSSNPAVRRRARPPSIHSMTAQPGSTCCARGEGVQLHCGIPCDLATSAASAHGPCVRRNAPSQRLKRHSTELQKHTCPQEACDAFQAKLWYMMLYGLMQPIFSE